MFSFISILCLHREVSAKWCVYCTKSEPIFKTKANRTRGARGGSKLNRTLHESPATASLHSATPKRKKFLALLIFAGVKFSKSKMERTFFFLRFCPPSIRAVWRGFNSDSVLRKLFSGDMDFRKTETNLFFAFCPRGGGVWGGILRLLRCFLLANLGGLFGYNYFSFTELSTTRNKTSIKPQTRIASSREKVLITW